LACRSEAGPRERRRAELENYYRADAVARAPLRGLARNQGDAPHVPADRGQGSRRARPHGARLGARTVLLDGARPDDLADPAPERRLRHRRRPDRPRPLCAGHGWSGRANPARAADGGRVPLRAVGAPRHGRVHGRDLSWARRCARRDPVRRGRRARKLRAGVGEPLLAGSRLRRPGAQGTPGPFSRQDLAGTALVGVVRSRLQPLAVRVTAHQPVHPTCILGV